jgi:Na+-transporting NADH:ubiquinone oxidoreductase subunit NqrE
MSEERIQRAPLVWEPLAAVACFIGAVLSLSIGFVFTTHWLLDDHLHPLLHALGLLLLVIGIPIMILGGHFMDLREKKLHDSKSINH